MEERPHSSSRQSSLQRRENGIPQKPDGSRGFGTSPSARIRQYPAVVTFHPAQEVNSNNLSVVTPPSLSTEKSPNSPRERGRFSWNNELPPQGQLFPAEVQPEQAEVRERSISEVIEAPAPTVARRSIKSRVSLLQPKFINSSLRRPLLGIPTQAADENAAEMNVSERTGDDLSDLSPRYSLTGTPEKRRTLAVDEVDSEWRGRSESISNEIFPDHGETPADSRMSLYDAGGSTAHRHSPEGTHNPADSGVRRYANESVSQVPFSLRLSASKSARGASHCMDSLTSAISLYQASLKRGSASGSGVPPPLHTPLSTGTRPSAALFSTSYTSQSSVSEGSASPESGRSAQFQSMQSTSFATSDFYNVPFPRAHVTFPPSTASILERSVQSEEERETEWWTKREVEERTEEERKQRRIDVIVAQRTRRRQMHAIEDAAGQVMAKQLEGIVKAVREQQLIITENVFLPHTFPNGDAYEGEWKNNRMHGQGCLRRSLTSYMHPNKENERLKSAENRDRDFSMDPEAYEAAPTITFMNQSGLKNPLQPDDGPLTGSRSPRYRRKGTVTHLQVQQASVTEPEGLADRRGSTVDPPAGEPAANAGDIYEGEWFIGMRNGQGTQHNSISQTMYRGKWVDNKRHGRGELVEPEGYFSGDFMKNCIQGYGEYVYKDGDTYRGEWLDELYHGTGTYMQPSGANYEGMWHAGREHGRGIATYHNGSLYVGEWLRGKCHGTGKLSTTMFTYEGEWANGAMCGNGFCQYANGSTYTGEFSKGMFHGKGQFISTGPVTDVVLAAATGGNAIWRGGRAHTHAMQWSSVKLHILQPAPDPLSQHTQPLQQTRNASPNAADESAVLRDPAVSNSSGWKPYSPLRIQQTHGTTFSNIATPLDHTLPMIFPPGAAGAKRMEGNTLLSSIYNRLLDETDEEYDVPQINFLGEGRNTTIYSGSYRNGLRHGLGRYQNYAVLYIGNWEKDKKHGYGGIRLRGGGMYIGQWRNDVPDGGGSFFSAWGDRWDVLHAKGVCIASEEIKSYAPIALQLQLSKPLGASGGSGTSHESFVSE